MTAIRSATCVCIIKLKPFQGKVRGKEVRERGGRKGGRKAGCFEQPSGRGTAEKLVLCMLLAIYALPSYQAHWPV